MRKTVSQLLVICGFCMAVCLTVSLSLISCENKNAKIFDYGKFDGDTYSNSYFGFRMDIPIGWYIFNGGELEQANKEAAAAIPNKAMREEMARAMDMQSIPLLTAYKAEPGSVSDFNPCVQVVAENLKWLPNVKTGEHYLQQSLETFRVSGMQYKELDVPVTSVEIGDMDFYTVKLLVSYGEYTVTQEWYSTVLDGFALNFGLMYDSLNQGQEQELIAIMESVLFASSDK